MNTAIAHPKMRPAGVKAREREVIKWDTVCLAIHISIHRVVGNRLCCIKTKGPIIRSNPGSHVSWQAIYGLLVFFLSFCVNSA